MTLAEFVEKHYDSLARGLETVGVCLLIFCFWYGPPWTWRRR